MTRLNKRTMIPILAAGCVLLMGASDDGCSHNDRVADRKMNAAQAKLAEEGVAQVGMPGVTNFTEKRMVRKLYELRDKAVSTFTYATDMQGRLWHVCDSIGFGLPYGVQFSNPHVPYSEYERGLAMADQAEPNGLFMPPSAEGTWVMCAGEKGAIDPMYVEPRVIVSTHRLASVGSWEQK